MRATQWKRSAIGTSIAYNGHVPLIILLRDSGISEPRRVGSQPKTAKHKPARLNLIRRVLAKMKAEGTFTVELDEVLK